MKDHLSLLKRLPNLFGLNVYRTQSVKQLEEQLLAYKHAFETTAVDRDRLAAALHNIEARIPIPTTSQPQNQEPLDVNKIAAVADFSLPPELAQSNFPTLIEWIRALLQHPAIIDLKRNALARAPEGSTIHATERAIMYAVMRDMKPRHSLEIGTYFAGTTKLLALAAHQTGGQVITIDPYGAERAPGLLREWPAELARRVSFRPQSSTEFLGPTNVIPKFELIFVDGDHRYPNALHDLLASDENLLAGGMMIIDNAEIEDVMAACRSFLRDQPDYEFVAIRETGSIERHPAISEKADTAGSSVCFAVMRKPKTVAIRERGIVYRIIRLQRIKASAITVRAICDGHARLELECVMRYFMRDPNNADCSNINYNTQIALTPGVNNHVVETSLVLPQKAEGEIMTVDITLIATPADGSVRDVELYWGGVKLDPNTNDFGA